MDRRVVLELVCRSIDEPCARAVFGWLIYVCWTGASILSYMLWGRLIYFYLILSTFKIIDYFKFLDL